MAKLVDVWIFDWDKYNPDDLVQKGDSFQLGPALLPALVKTGRATTCGPPARLRRPDQDQADQAEHNGGQQQCQRCAHCASLDRLAMDEANQRQAPGVVDVTIACADAVISYSITSS